MFNPPYFRRLGIEPTHDVKVIKRAYALMLRTIDQQHEREAFEQLRRDYEQAIAWARSPPHNDIGGNAGQQDRLDHDNSDDQDGIPPAGAPDVPPFDGLVPDLAHGLSVDPSADPSADPPPDPPAFETGHDTDTAQSGGANSAPAPIVPVVPSIRRVEPAGTSLLASRQAINEWIARLFEARDTSIADGLDAALRDERLAHLDSQSQLEAQLADALYNNPEGRAALFDAAARRFGWTSRHVTSIRDVAVAAWISKVVNQDLQWHAQQSAARLTQDAALKAAMSTGSPSNAVAYQFMPVLDQIHDAVPQWLALRISAQRLRDWHNAHSAISTGWLRRAAFKQQFTRKLREPRKPAKLTRKSLITICVCFGVAGLILTAFESPPLGTPRADTQTQTPDQKASGAAAGTDTPKAPDGPVLAYELTGAITKDSCEEAHEFVHESNWLEVDDPSANALLTSRALLCQDRKLWPTASDPLLTCLRIEHLAALNAGRLDDNRHCEAPASGKK